MAQEWMEDSVKVDYMEMGVCAVHNRTGGLVL
jgi:hypothetical protein